MGDVQWPKDMANPLAEPLEKFDPDQPRDEGGRFADAGGGGGGDASASSDSRFGHLDPMTVAEGEAHGDRWWRAASVMPPEKAADELKLDEDKAAAAAERLGRRIEENDRTGGEVHHLAEGAVEEVREYAMRATQAVKDHEERLGRLPAGRLRDAAEAAVGRMRESRDRLAGTAEQVKARWDRYLQSPAHVARAAGTAKFDPDQARDENGRFAGGGGGGGGSSGGGASEHDQQQASIRTETQAERDMAKETTAQAEKSVKTAQRLIRQRRGARRAATILHEAGIEILRSKAAIGNLEELARESASSEDQRAAREAAREQRQALRPVEAAYREARADFRSTAGYAAPTPNEEDI